MKPKFNTLWLFGMLLIAFSTFAQPTAEVTAFQGSLTLNNPQAYTNSEMVVNHAVKNELGETYLTGYFKGDVNFHPNGGSTWRSSNQGINGFNRNDAFFMKLDSTGNIEWLHTFGDDRNDSGELLMLANDGTVYLLGSSPSNLDLDFGPGQHLINNFASAYGSFIAAYQPNGNLIWAGLLNASYSLASSSISCQATSLDIYQNELRIALSNRGALYYNNTLLGFENAYGSPPNVGFVEDIYVVSLNRLTGGHLWNQRSFSVPGAIGTDIYGLGHDSQGNVYAAGTVNGTVRFNSADLNTHYISGYEDGFIWKLDKTGNFRDVKFIRSQGIYSSSQRDHLSSLHIDNDKLYIGGYFYGDSVDLDPGPSSVQIVKTGSGTDAFLVEWDTTLSYHNHLHWSGLGNQILYNIQTDSLRNVYALLQNSGSTFIDPVGQTLPATEYTGLGYATSNIIMACFNEQFQFQFGLKTSSPSANASSAVARRSSVGNGHWLVSGYFKGQINLNPTNNSLFSAAGTQDGFFIDIANLPQPLPQVQTLNATLQSAGEALFSASIPVGTGNVQTKGFCWNFTGNPNFNDAFVNLSANSPFAYTLTPLNAGSTYYVRAFAISLNQDTVFGNELSLLVPVSCLNGGGWATRQALYSLEFSHSLFTTTPNVALQYRLQGENQWTQLPVSGASRTVNNLAPGLYEYRFYGIGTADTLCIDTIGVFCARNVQYSANVFQAGYLDALPANSARVNIFNVSGGKSLYKFELENIISHQTLRAENRRNYTFSQLNGGIYYLRVFDAFNCLADSVMPVVINALDTAYIPNLISAVNSSPNGFRPIWNRPRQNGQIMPGVLSYQLRVRNETDNQLVNVYTNIADTFLHVNNLIPGKLYRFNVRSRYNPGSGAQNSAYSIRRDRNLGIGGNKNPDVSMTPTANVRVYPNPTPNICHIEAQQGSNIKLLDMQGRLLQKLEPTNLHTEIDLSPYAAGTYMLIIEGPTQPKAYKIQKL